MGVGRVSERLVGSVGFLFLGEMRFWRGVE